MRKIEKIRVVGGVYYDRGIPFTHIRIRAKIEQLKNTKVLYEVEWSGFDFEKDVTEYKITVEDLIVILNKYQYDLDLQVIVNKFNRILQIWSEER